MKAVKRFDPIHPGEILLDDFMKPLGISIDYDLRLTKQRDGDQIIRSVRKLSGSPT